MGFSALKMASKTADKGTLMSPGTRSRSLAGVLALAGCLGLASSTAHAQPNTYADFPYNQGSLFYRYGGARAARPSAPRRARVPQSYYRSYGPAPRPPATTYVPQGGYYYYYPQYQYQPQWSQPRLFGRVR